MATTAPLHFTIPLQREDLTKEPENPWEYYVRNEYSVRDLKTKLNECELAVKQSGAGFLTADCNGFDVLYSVLGRFNGELPAAFKRSAFGLLERATGDVVQKLDAFLEQDPGSMATAEKTGLLTCTKMLVYLVCQMLELFEAAETSGMGDLLVVKRRGTAKGSGKKSKQFDDDGGVSGETDIMTTERKNAAVSTIYRLLHLNLALLFDPPVVEEDFVNAIASCMFRLLEAPSIALVKGRVLKESVFQVLGTLNAKYNYSLSCRLKIVQSLRHFEHLALPMAEAVAMFAKEYNSPSMVAEIIRELSQINPAELSRDTSATRAYSLFLIELSERVPDLMKPCLSLLMIHLDGDSYAMRKCVLAILIEIILKTLKPREDQEDMSEEQEEMNKEARDQFLDCLEDHVHDVHAFVRTAVLQGWGKLCDAKAIPLSRQQRLLQLVKGRLQDKSSNVRKQAVQLLTSLLQCNPFLAAMHVEELREQLKKETKKLEELVEREGGQRREEAWEAFKVVLDEELEKESGEDSPVDEDAVWEGAARGEVYTRLQHLMRNQKKAGKAISLLKSAALAFPDDDVFGMAASVAAEAEAVASSQDEKKEEKEGEDVVGHLSEDDRIRAVLKTIYLTDLEVNKEQEVLQEELIKQKGLVLYLGDSFGFAEEMNNALPTVCLLLGSKQISDVLEAINFFITAHNFGLLSALIGVRKMLTLIWSREQDIKKAVVSAYRKLYIPDGNKPNEIVKNFIDLVQVANVGELTSLEVLVGMLVQSGEIGKECFQVLWRYFTKTIGEDTTGEQSRAAVVLLGMVANAEPGVITQNLNVLVTTGLGERGLRDLRLAHDTCVALSKIAPSKPSSTLPPTRYDTDHEIFTHVEKLFVDGVTEFSDPFYVPMSQKALMVVYSLSEQPDALAGRIIKKICSIILENRDRRILQRLFSIVGHVALCQLNHLDVSLLNELKRRKDMEEKKKERDKRRSVASSVTKKRRSKAAAAADDGDDLEVVGAEAEDMEYEAIRNVCEKEIVSRPGVLLQTFLPIIQHICTHTETYPDANLRSAASLALSKLMLVSSECCENNLQLLFTLMEKSPEPLIRANLVIATGDLSFRFPNSLEPWTPHMYARLRDVSSHVRCNALTVLTHLILNDMIKVKGQISDMAFCIADDVEKISGLAKHFFAELSQKGNALYNAMPDIISRLSAESEDRVSEETFHAIMSYIVGLIEKDKHLEALVEKLCHRFRLTESERQWRDLAYCLSLFKFSDKAVKKLVDNFSCFSDKLHEEDVFNAFAGILVHAKKLAKQETKLIIEEMEDKLGKARDKCMEDHTAGKRAHQARKGKRKSKAGEKADSDDEEEEVKEEDKSESETEDNAAMEVDDEASEKPKETPQRTESSDSNGSVRSTRKRAEKSTMPPLRTESSGSDETIDSSSKRSSTRNKRAEIKDDGEESAGNRRSSRPTRSSATEADEQKEEEATPARSSRRTKRKR